MCLFSFNAVLTILSFTALLPVLYLSRCVLRDFIFPGNTISKAKALIFCSRVSKVKPSNARQLSCSLEEEHFTPAVSHSCGVFFFYIYYLYSWVRIHDSWFLHQLQNTGTLGSGDACLHAPKAGDRVTEQELWSSGEVLHTPKGIIFLQKERARRASTGLILCRLSENTKEPEGALWLPESHLYSRLFTLSSGNGS